MLRTASYACLELRPFPPPALPGFSSATLARHTPGTDVRIISNFVHKSTHLAPTGSNIGALTMFVGITVLDKDEFVERAIARKLGLNEIVTAAREEIQRAESKSRLVRGAPANRAAGASDYVGFLGALVYFLQSEAIPADLSDDNFPILFRLAAYLVRRGNLNSAVLELSGADSKPEKGSQAPPMARPKRHKQTQSQ